MILFIWNDATVVCVGRTQSVGGFSAGLAATAHVLEANDALFHS